MVRQGEFGTMILKENEGSFYVKYNIHTDPDVTQKLRVILCPGYLDSKDYCHFKTLADKLALQGANVIRFDAPGTWTSSPRIEEYTADNYLRATDFFVKGARFPVVLIGHSRGAKWH